MMIPSQFLRTNAAQRTLALFLVATLATVPAVAANRAPRLHAASHAPGHVIATHSAAPVAHGRHASRVEAAEARTSRQGKKASAHERAAAPEPRSKSHGKGKHGKQHEPEYVDDPVVMHRASAHGRPLTKRQRQLEAARERAEELAEARYEAAHRHAPKQATQRHQAEEYVATREPLVREPAPRETSIPDSQYASRAYTATYDNVARAVDKTARPNAFTREGSTQVGTALRATPDTSSQAPDSIADKARRSSVVMKPAAQPAKISASDAPVYPAQGQYQPRVASGFGAEVTPLPQANRRDSANNQALAEEAQDLGEDLAVNGVASARTLANDAMQPLVTPMYNREGSLLMPAPLRGSHEILVHQNTMADHDGLERIRDDYQLNHMVAQRTLVSFPESASLRVNEGLPYNRRYARPWTVQFAADMGRAFYQRFGEPLQVNSAVRTVSYQLRLQRVNGNAAATRGEGASPHLTGQAIDFAKRGMSTDQLAWMRTYLLPYIDAGKIDVEEEFQQACFHISVYRAYLPLVRRAPVQQVAQYRPLPATAATILPGSQDTDR